MQENYISFRLYPKEVQEIASKKGYKITEEEAMDILQQFFGHCDLINIYDQLEIFTEMRMIE